MTAAARMAEAIETGRAGPGITIVDCELAPRESTAIAATSRRKDPA
ncbi:hypothetical protein O1R50_22805 [Glycomyces luteolus]|uniref:Uncharacterized protein n=1 Tax=Glycomyces luteolus TaxID=2670330 RepID=A0A9X3T5X8_9ACTN|nr:hypothetical protein [Glycomyces luteolus]MDA1362470.1 hypothetical protein [Glycomyces luteolus]